MDDNEVIAVVLSGYDDEGRPRATVLLRDGLGQVSLKQMSAPEARARAGGAGRLFRPGRPILDPASREVMGYELECVRSTH